MKRLHRVKELLKNHILRNTAMQTQDKAKWIQAKHAKRVEWFMWKTSCTLYPKRDNRDKANVWKYEVTELSNVNIYIVRVN